MSVGPSNHPLTLHCKFLVVNMERREGSFKGSKCIGWRRQKRRKEPKLKESSLWADRNSTHTHTNTQTHIYIKGGVCFLLLELLPAIDQKELCLNTIVNKSLRPCGHYVHAEAKRLGHIAVLTANTTDREGKRVKEEEEDGVRHVDKSCISHIWRLSGNVRKSKPLCWGFCLLQLQFLLLLLLLLLLLCPCAGRWHVGKLVLSRLHRLLAHTPFHSLLSLPSSSVHIWFWPDAVQHFATGN